MWWFDAWVVDGIVNGVRHLTVVAFGYGSDLFDKHAVDGAVNGACGAKSGSMMFRRVQSGLVQNYALIMGGGIVLIALVYLFMKP
jgi:NADH:ubiquinone oxidoreductase subunit 5 (subunit L)/multisubunit Na+/H+ antiporter MnhA subunit